MRFCKDFDKVAVGIRVARTVMREIWAAVGVNCNLPAAADVLWALVFDHARIGGNRDTVEVPYLSCLILARVLRSGC